MFNDLVVIIIVLAMVPGCFFENLMLRMVSSITTVLVQDSQHPIFAPQCT